MDVSYAIIYGISALVISTGLFYFAKISNKVSEYMNMNLTKSQIELVKSLGQQAVIYIRKEYGDKSGEEQFDEAVNYLIKLLAEFGIVLSKEIVLSAVQDAYQQAKNNGLVKPLD